MRIWVNGAVTDADQATVSVLDHGFTVGDGVFETLKVAAGIPFALTAHLARLGRSARGLGLPDPDPGLVRRAVAELLAAGPVPEFARLRITYTGGPAPLGSERGDTGPTLVLAVSAARRPDPDTAVVTVEWPRNERSATAGLKSTSYAENVVALARAHRAGASEALLPNTVGELCEGTGSNVFLVLDGALYTPPLSSGCLAGVTRDLVLRWCGAAERTLPMSALTEAEEVFLTSTLRDVQPVRVVDDRTLPTAPGPLTHKAAEVFAARAAEEVDP